jgi:single-strand DNA-binding protein
VNINKVFLGGRLTRNPELRYTPGGTGVAAFGIAVNRKWKAKDGSAQEEVTFLDCEAWGKTAEIITEHFTKGRPIFIEGRLKLDSWESKQGEKRSKVKVVADSFQFVGKAEPAAEKAPPQEAPEYDPNVDDEIPF